MRVILIPFPIQVKIIPPKMLKLNIAFFDIETDFDPDRGFADRRSMSLLHSVYLQWMETMICLAVPQDTYNGSCKERT